MGFFSKIKNLFKKEEFNELRENEKKEIEIYDSGLSKSRNEFVSSLNILGKKYNRVNDEFYDELEEILILADVGVNTVMDFIDRLKKRVKSESITDFKYLKEVIVDELFLIYVNDDILSSKINFNPNGITTILFVGVNGVGKTTTIAKLANTYKNMGKKVLLIASDTFRAGSTEQLMKWALSVGVDCFTNGSTDPSSVAYDGLKKAKEENYDLVLIDTAGRLQNKINLMKELEKLNKVIDNFVDVKYKETLLVIDASTGQNGISQAKSFKEITNVTGIVLTKMDGTAKGGIVLAIKESVNIPVKYIGLGEKMTDLAIFDIEKYIYGLFKEF